MSRIDDDIIHMQRAFALARRAEGMTRPNPPVGAVIVKAGRIVGEGYHHGAGTPHAEVHAIRVAGRRARGATIYVTLEPCCTHGRTPPCTDAILAAGIKEVIFSVRDPNPRHAGRAIAILRRAGIRVTEGTCAEEGAELIAPFAKWMTTGRPYLTLKLGTTVDGRIADSNARSRWITGPKARHFVQDLRRRVDAVLVGGRTAALDNPSLLPRPGRGRKPFRVIVDSRGQLPARLTVLNDAARDRTIIATTRACPARVRARYEKQGAQVWILPSRKDHVDLNALFGKLAGHSVLHVLCEGGGLLAGTLIRQKLVDEYVFFIAPCILGEGLPAVATKGWPIDGMPRLRFTSVKQVGDDVMIRAIPGKD